MHPLEPKRERRLLWLLALTQFTIIMDFMVMMPLGPQIMQAFAIGPAAFATAVSAYSWCSGISGLLAATYIDRFDRRRLLLVMYALFVASNIACALASSFLLLLFARSFAGLAGGVLASVVMTIISDVIPAQRRGAATGILMTGFSIAAVAGVPAGVLLGAHFGWWAPFVLLVVLSSLIWFACSNIIPSLREHLAKAPVPLARVLPELWYLITLPSHLRAYLLTFTVMVAQMMVIPFISPVLVANHDVQPAQLSWLYMAGGAATFFTSRQVGKLADRFGRRRVFCVVALLSIIPVLFMTHLPQVPYYVILGLFPVFMILASGRFIPMQALLTTVPQPEHRGAFLSLNSAIQSIGTGCGAWIGGLLLTSSADGHITGYGNNGLIATAIVLFGVMWIHAVKGSGSGAEVPAHQRPAQSNAPAAPLPTKLADPAPLD